MNNTQELIEILPFPEFENTFNSINSNEKFVFLPLATLQFKKHSEFENKSFHFVSIWDTGDYEESFFNEFRKSISCIKFKIENNKYSYPEGLNFPFVDLLSQAYDLTHQNFQQNLDYYLEPKSYHEFSSEKSIFSQGREFVFNSLNGIDKFESSYYYERITQYLYTKEKYKLFDKINPQFTYSETFIGITTTKEEVMTGFNEEGKSKDEIINNLLGTPEWLQSPEEIPEKLNLIFIGSVYEGDFTNGSAEIYLFWDKENDEAYQFFQWT
ncbi:hypothetical protein [Flavobacterium luteolum]|uniref:hypothetical protein n=1 Tax=Flavobacterium luteolum TaxID=3003259 RepID=UPI00248D4766|nr:hypothetical protein [Flavobacterium luteolum]